MYLSGGRSYHKADGSLHVLRDNFLILMQDKTRPCSRGNMRGIVRIVAMSQLGQFMMGRARIKNRTIILSGTYGSDGLPVSVEPAVFQMGVPMPKPLYDRWASGGGWNSAGSEALALKEWGRAIELRNRKWTRMSTGLRAGRIRKLEWRTFVAVTNRDGTILEGGKLFVRPGLGSAGTITTSY